MRDAQVIRMTAEELLPRVGELAAHVQASIAARDVALGLNDPEVADALLQAAEANIVNTLSTMAFGLAPGPMELSDADRRLVDLAAEDPAGLPALLRVTRVGGEELWQMWAAQVARRVGDLAQLDRVSRATSAHVALYVDRLSEALAARWVRSVRAAGGLERRRTAAVRALLAGGEAEVADLGHPLERPQLTLGLRRVPGTPARVATRARRLVAEHLGDPPRLDLALPDGTELSWLALPEALTTPALDAALALVPDGLWASAAPAAPGAGAIRAGGGDVQDALRVLERTRPGGGAAPHAALALLATLLADEDRARRFALGALGPLADGSARSVRLRATLRAVFAHGGHAGAAAALGVHEKTVAHRLRQAEEALGGPLAPRRTELAAALEVLHALDGVVPAL